MGWQSVSTSGTCISPAGLEGTLRVATRDFFAMRLGWHKDAPIVAASIFILLPETRRDDICAIRPVRVPPTAFLPNSNTGR